MENIVLNARFKWMLELFKKNRKEWPERVVITRDGVSEGQYRMVCAIYSFFYFILLSIAVTNQGIES